MTDPRDADAAAWGLPGVLDFFETARSTTEQVYRSEWIFLREKLAEGMSVLDVGCAQGGFASVLSEHLNAFDYTGVDVNPDMVARARRRFPGHRFERVAEGDLAALGDETFDLVLVLGLLHLHAAWRDTLAAAWACTAGCLLFDLRQVAGPTVEDRTRSWFRMDFHRPDAAHGATVLPYNLVNAGEALETVTRLCPGAAQVSQFGYLHPVSGAASVPVSEVMATAWCVEREPAAR